MATFPLAVFAAEPRQADSALLASGTWLTARAGVNLNLYLDLFLLDRCY